MRDVQVAFDKLKEHYSDLRTVQREGRLVIKGFEFGFLDERLSSVELVACDA